MPVVPRRKQPGSPITAQDWNALVDAIERLRPMAGAGVELCPTATGTVWSVVGPPGAVRWVKTTGSLAAAVPPAYSTATANFAKDSGTSPMTDSGQSVPNGVRWSFNKTVASGSYGVAVQDASTGYWWAILFDCAKLS